MQKLDKRNFVFTLIFGFVNSINTFVNQRSFSKIGGSFDLISEKSLKLGDP